MSHPTAAVLPLSPMQLGMLYHHLVDENRGLDILQIVVELPAHPDPEILRTAWQEVVDRHMVLHSSVARDGENRAVWQVEATPQVPFRISDWSAMGSGDVDGSLEKLLAQDRTEGFDLSQAPLTRVHLIRLPGGEATCVWTVPHLVLDAGSFELVLQEVWACYEAKAAGAEPNLPSPPSFGEYLTWRANHQEPGSQAFWTELLQGFRTPVDVSSGSKVDGGTLEISRTLPAGLTDRLETTAKDLDVRPSTLVLAAWSIVLSRFGGETDVVFGQTRSGRPGTVEGADEMVGLFINTVPTRARVDPERPLPELLKELRQQQVGVRPFEHTPLTEIQAWCDLPRNSTLFQSIVVFDRESLGHRMQALGGPWASRNAYLRERLSSDLTLHAYGDDPLLLVAVADGRKFGAERVEALLEGLESILQAMVDEPDARVGKLPLLGDARQREILLTWNDTAKELPSERTIHGQFATAVGHWPETTAIRGAGTSLTYRELDARSNRLARHLQGMGVGPGTLVGLVAERSVESMVGLLGILKAGGAYVPLDPEFPLDRLGFMIQDSGIEVLLTVRERMGALPEHGARVVHLNPDGRAFQEDDAPVESPAAPEDLSYVMYTSGSTGRPKGVAVEHRNVTAFFSGMDDHLGTEPGVWLSVTTLSFDISVLELLWTLTRGFEVVLYHDERAPLPQGGASAVTATKLRPIDFSLFYFSADEGADPGKRYQLLLEGARFADRRGFKAVWTPERHFHAFGGLYPNPAVTGAALATITENVEIRSGSVVLPLHHPARVVEEWSVVDNLSGGRVGVSFASGWQADDFCLRPDNYEDRKSYLYEGIETVKRLWRGETINFPGPKGDVAVRTLPRPIQAELPIWVTTAGSVESFESAGETGANILTHLLGQSVEDIEEKIGVYRDARRAAGHEGPGCVSLMLHTFIGEDDDEVRELVREPMKNYLRTAVGLMKNFQQAWEIYRDRSRRKEQEGGFEALSDEDMDSLLDFAFERYYETSGLFGSLERCEKIVDRLRVAGVDDIACLIDFGVDTEKTLTHLENLAALRMRVKDAEAHGKSDSPAVGFAGQLRRYGVTHVQCTPSRMRMFLADPEGREALRQVGTVLIGGEAFPGPLAAEVRGIVRGRVLNMYGPTETTIWSAVHELEPEDDQAVIPIGRPIANTRLYVVDSGLQPVPPDVPGELLIGGAGVVRGYLDRPELTRERFLPDPFSDDPHARVYRTGDLVQQRGDGVTEFLGRIDHQVKIRGHRIELGEIDAVLTGHPHVTGGVTVVREPTPGDLRLVSYYVSDRRGPEFEEELREALARSLPEVMVPSILVGLEALPTTPNGKIDRKALPEPSAAGRRKAGPGEAPRSELEKQIAAIWTQELGVESLRIDENFFDAGGHSLLAVQVQARLQSELERRIPLIDLFRFPTVRAFAEHLGDGGDGRVAADEGVDRAAKRRQSRRARTAGGEAD